MQCYSVVFICSRENIILMYFSFHLILERNNFYKKVFFVICTYIKKNILIYIFVRPTNKMYRFRVSTDCFSRIKLSSTDKKREENAFTFVLWLAKYEMRKSAMERRLDDSCQWCSGCHTRFAQPIRRHRWPWRPSAYVTLRLQRELVAQSVESWIQSCVVARKLT